MQSPRIPVLQITLAILTAVAASAATAAEPTMHPLAEHFGMEEAAGLRWLHLSSHHGDLPVPTTSRQQSAALIADLDKDGRNDFVLTFREKGPALVWYRRTAAGWDRYTIEKDVFWTVHAGQDPLKLLKKYPRRWTLMQLKDMRKGMSTGKTTGAEDVNDDVTLGTVQIDLAAVLRAAQRQAVEHYFIEDESPRSLEQIPRSLKFLESLAW